MIAYRSTRHTIIICAGFAIIICVLVAVTAIGARRIAATFPPAGRFVEVDGGRIHLVELGNADDATPLVLLHGAMVNLGDMRLALGERLALNHRVILIDRPGHGWSDRPDGAADASPTRQAALVHQALEGIGVTRAIIVAHSWSGALALAYALQYPAAVSGLELLAPFAYPRPQDAGWHLGVLRALFAYSAATLEDSVWGPALAHTVTLPVGETLLSLGVRSAFAPQHVPPNYIALTGAELLLRPLEIVASAQDIEGIDEYLFEQARRYVSIRIPARILVGDADEALSPDIQAKALARVLPQAKLQVLPGVGHMVHYAAPDRVIEAIEELFDEVKQPSPS